MFEKHKPGRSVEYLDYIRSQRCYACLRDSPSEPHHTQTGGTAMKGSDFSAIPLCHEHHRECQDGKSLFEQRHSIVVSEAVEKYLVQWCDEHCSEEAR